MCSIFWLNRIWSLSATKDNRLLHHRIMYHVGSNNKIMCQTVHLSPQHSKSSLKIANIKTTTSNTQTIIYRLMRLNCECAKQTLVQQHQETILPHNQPLCMNRIKHCAKIDLKMQVTTDWNVTIRTQNYSRM